MGPEFTTALDRMPSELPDPRQTTPPPRPKRSILLLLSPLHRLYGFKDYFSSKLHFFLIFINCLLTRVIWTTQRDSKVTQVRQ